MKKVINFKECKNCDAAGSSPFRRWNLQMDKMKPYFNFYNKIDELKNEIQNRESEEHARKQEELIWS